MYQAFKDAKQNLPGDEEILKTHKPNVKIYLYPMKTGNSLKDLPKLTSPQLIVQANMTIESLKKYLMQKFATEITDKDEVIVVYKGRELKNEWSLRDVDRMIPFDSEKTVMHFYKK